MPRILPGETDIYAITDAGLSLGRPLEEVVSALMGAGVRILQYREKKLKSGAMDVGFTAQMEENLDKVAEGQEQWVELLRRFSEDFNPTLAAASKNMKSLKGGMQVQVESLRRAAQIAGLQYDNGYTDYLTVLDAERQLFAAELRLATALRDRLDSVVSVCMSRMLTLSRTSSCSTFCTTPRGSTLGTRSSTALGAWSGVCRIFSGGPYKKRAAGLLPAAR